MGGGDLLNLLIERDVFEEDFTRFYVAEVRWPAPALRLLTHLKLARLMFCSVALHYRLQMYESYSFGTISMRQANDGRRLTARVKQTLRLDWAKLCLPDHWRYSTDIPLGRRPRLC